MIIASHVIFGAYGFWLPNDPRGSWSTFVGSWELYRYGGPATKVSTQRSVAATPHDRAARLAVKEKLKYPAVAFSEEQRATISDGFGRFVEKSGLRIFACAILAEHVHLVVARHTYHVEQAVVLLKGEASRILSERNVHPMAKFPRHKGRLATCWARGEWKVFLDDMTDLKRSIAYVEGNPAKEGLAPQNVAVCASVGGGVFLDASRLGVLLFESRLNANCINPPARSDRMPIRGGRESARP